MENSFEIARGFPFPFGPTRYSEGINFSIFSKHATAVSLCLFKPGEIKPFQEISLNPKRNKTGDVWHIFLFDLPTSFEYGYRVDGPYDPFKGLIFDRRNILLDPYSRLSASPNVWGHQEPQHVHKAVAYPFERAFNWEDDDHPNIPLKDLIIYEMHVRGFTQDPSSKVDNKGTFLGVIEKIPFLKTLGVNAVELMPIYEFNEMDNILKNPKTNERLFNYWGYSTKNFFSPMNRFGTGKQDTLTEFKMLVKALHENGIEVILDVVYNHTSEGNKNGPSISFKGLENTVYYMLAPNGEYYNFSGCGNTFNCNNSIVREFIKDSLRYWVTEMHVDGFRFDLASILSRGHDGIPLVNPPIVEAITQDPILAKVKLIAEAWDAGGLYQVGTFPGTGRWAEWNGPYRDNVRRFIKGSDGEIGNFATRLCGSEDLYGRGRRPYHSINYVTAHDGFSLADLVSYNSKHNEENGEDNRDGSDQNDSWNCGVEGATDDPTILTLRERQMKNFHLALMVSQGVPMVLMGDEYGHTKNGNNNTWSHDSRLNWFQWDTLEKKQSFFRFYRMMIAFRKKHPALRKDHFLSDRDISWHGIEPLKPDWGFKSRFLAFSLADKDEKYALYVAFNTYFHEVVVHLPWRDNNWQRIADTSLAPPEDIVEEAEAPEITKKTYTLAPYSSLILRAKEYSGLNLK